MSRKILFLMIGLCLSVCVKGQLFEDYCQGKLATSTSGTIDGRIGSGEVSLAIRLTSEQLKAYKDCQLSVVSFGIPESDAVLPESFTAWVRTSRDAENLAAGSAKCEFGWNNISLANPYTLTGDETELWVGVSWTQSGKLKIISFDGLTSPNGCWTAKGATWTDYSSKNYGSLAIRAGFTGESMPQHSLILSDFGAKSVQCKVGKNFVLTGKVTNRGILTAEHPQLEVSVDGQLVETANLPAVASSGATTFEVSVPTSESDALGDKTISVNLLWGDGQTDEHPEDNVGQTTMKFADTYLRRIVFEEFTGTWCQWCPLGIVGLRKLIQNHPGEVIGIAVHNGDEFTVSAYDNYMYANGYSGTTFPNSNMNRSTQVYPDPDQLEFHFSLCSLVADADVEVAAWREGQTLHVTSDVTFDIDADTKKYRMAYVVTENGVTGTQKNGYATQHDPKVEEFNNLAYTCVIAHDHVARGILPSPAGEVRNFGNGHIVKGETYTLDESLSLYGVTIKDEANVEVVALLINDETGFIVNAAKCKLAKPTGIERVKGYEVRTKGCYDLQGRKIQRPSGHGIFIENNKKYIR